VLDPWQKGVPKRIRFPKDVKKTSSIASEGLPNEGYPLG